MSDDVLGLARGTVRLAEYTPRWAELFEAEAARLRAALGPLARAIEHYGSTSVPGLVAKPILDILVAAPSIDDPRPFAEALAPLGYELARDAVPGHLVFGKGAPRTHLVHVVPEGGEAWRRALRFRDALRADPAVAAEYAALKRELAARYPEARGSYTAAKTDFVERVLARPAISVRHATAADAPTLARLRYEFRAPLGPVTEAEEAFVARCEAWMRERLAAGGAWRAWVAEDDAGEVVGTIWVGVVEKLPNPTPEPEEHAYVTNVYVRPGLRGAGVGSALLHEALAWCEARGVHAAVLWPTARSAPLYRRHGFRTPAAILEREFGPGPERGLPDTGA